MHSEIPGEIDAQVLGLLRNLCPNTETSWPEVPEPDVYVKIPSLPGMPAKFAPEIKPSENGRSLHEIKLHREGKEMTSRDRMIALLQTADVRWCDWDCYFGELRESEPAHMPKDILTPFAKYVAEFRGYDLDALLSAQKWTPAESQMLSLSRGRTLDEPPKKDLSGEEITFDLLVETYRLLHEAGKERFDIQYRDDLSDETRVIFESEHYLFMAAECENNESTLIYIGSKLDIAIYASVGVRDGVAFVNLPNICYGTDDLDRDPFFRDIEKYRRGGKHDFCIEMMGTLTTLI